MTMPEHEDWRVEALTELEDIGRRLWELKHRIGDEIRREQRVLHHVMQALRKEPAPGFETRTHQFCEQRCSGGLCAEDDPPGRDL